MWKCGNTNQWSELILVYLYNCTLIMPFSNTHWPFIDSKTQETLLKDHWDEANMHLQYLVQIGFLPKNLKTDDTEIGKHFVSELNSPLTKIQYWRYLIEFPFWRFPWVNLLDWIKTFDIEIDGKEKIILSNERLKIVKEHVEMMIGKSEWDPRIRVNLSNVWPLLPVEFYRVKNIIRIIQKW